MKSSSKIYALIDPRTGCVMYVGRTINILKRRLWEHVRSAKKNKPAGAKSEWINSLIKSGSKPVVHLIEMCGDDWRERERYWCGQFTSLLNKNKAGGGGSSHRINGLPQSAIELLGKVSDSKVATLCGISRKAISYYREQLKIPASNDKSSMKPPPMMGGHNRKELRSDVIALLCTMPDAKLAVIANVSKKRIMNERHKLGIKSCAEAGGNSGKYYKGMGYHPRWS